MMTKDLKLARTAKAIIAISVVALAIWLRPDVSLALFIIEDAWVYPEGDWRVQSAADYLIAAEHPRTYDSIDHFLWACHGNPDYTDFRAAITAYILGSIKTEQALDSLEQVFELNHVEGRAYCEKYVWTGLVLHGDKGYQIIEEVAEGKRTNLVVFRGEAMRLLGQTGDPKYLDLLIDLLLNETNGSLRYGAVQGLAFLGTPEAMDYLEYAANEDSSEEVRELARQALDDLENTE